MGQRIVISEEEKKHIKKLYEAETIPPDESTFVIKTNPFNKKEYFNARQPYSGELKNGDLYVNIDYSRLSEWIEQELSKLITGKTIRFTGDDVIMNFGKVRSVDLINDWRFANFSISAKFNPEKTNIIYTIYFDGDNNTSISKINLIPTNFGTVVNEMNGKAIQGKPLYKAGSDDLTKMLKILSPFNLTNLPDEYFEIRKIERKPTDF